MSRKLQGPVTAEDLNDLSSPLTLLQTRRSCLAKSMGEPGPNHEEIDKLLEMAVRVPDHGKLAPWRFIVFQGEGRQKAGNVLAARWRALYPDHSKDTVELQRAMFLRAPLVIAVVSSPVVSEKIPEWEQVLSAGAVCHNLLLGATAMQFGAQWISGWYGYDRQVLESFGLTEAERIAGYIFVGTGIGTLEDRPRPDHKQRTEFWNG